MLSLLQPRTAQILHRPFLTNPFFTDPPSNHFITTTDQQHNREQRQPCTRAYVCPCERARMCNCLHLPLSPHTHAHLHHVNSHVTTRLRVRQCIHPHLVTRKYCTYTSANHDSTLTQHPRQAQDHYHFMFATTPLPVFLLLFLLLCNAMPHTHLTKSLL